jgi:hypothetical protein
MLRMDLTDHDRRFLEGYFSTDGSARQPRSPT